MTFKECRKYGREQINASFEYDHGFVYKDKKGDYTFSFAFYNSSQPVYCLEKNGVVDKIVNGLWKWDYEKRGMRPENKKGWNKRV